MSWFTVKVRYTKQNEDGSFKRVTEPYLLAAVSFTDAEKRIYEELENTIRGEFHVMSINITELHDIFDNEQSDVWFKTKISYSSVDDSDKAKKVTQTFYLNADSVKDADSSIKEELSTMLVDFTVDSVVKTKIVDVFPIKIED